MVSQNRKVALIVTTYFFVSMSLVFANKIILEDDIFPFPLTMTWFQFVLQLIGLKFSQYLGSKYLFPPLSFSQEKKKKKVEVTDDFDDDHVCLMIGD